MQLDKEAERLRPVSERVGAGRNIVVSYFCLGVILVLALSTARDVLHVVEYGVMVFLFCLVGAQVGFPMARIRRDLDDARKEIRELRAHLAAAEGRIETTGGAS